MLYVLFNVKNKNLSLTEVKIFYIFNLKSKKYLTLKRHNTLIFHKSLMLRQILFWKKNKKKVTKYVLVDTSDIFYFLNINFL